MDTKLREGRWSCLGQQRAVVVWRDGKLGEEIPNDDGGGGGDEADVEEEDEYGEDDDEDDGYGEQMRMWRVRGGYDGDVEGSRGIWFMSQIYQTTPMVNKSRFKGSLVNMACTFECIFTL